MGSGRGSLQSGEVSLCCAGERHIRSSSVPPSRSRTEARSYRPPQSLSPTVFPNNSYMFTYIDRR